jgi:hypothetical protein
MLTLEDLSATVVLLLLAAVLVLIPLMVAFAYSASITHTLAASELPRDDWRNFNAPSSRYAPIDRARLDALVQRVMLEQLVLGRQETPPVSP